MSFCCRPIPVKFLLTFMFLIAFILLVAPNVVCAQLFIEWDESPSPGVDGYIMYYGTQSGNYTESVDVGNTTSCTISNLVAGQTYYFAVSAYYNNNSGFIEGGLSEELSHTIPVGSIDNDGDGSSEAQGDCNDEDATVYPGASETCGDGIDQDCDGADIVCPEDVGNKVWLEAENGALNWPVEVAEDQSASSGSYIVVPNGSGSIWDSSQATGTVLYTFQISETGQYVIWGRVLAASGGDDSFFIAIDDGGDALWDAQQANIWVWDQVNDRNGPDPVVYFLEAGEHTLRIEQREDGTKLDRILISSNPNYVPEGLGEDSTAPTVNAQYTLTVNAANSGSVSLDPAGGIYEEGTIVQLKAAADPGWEFGGWSGDLTGTTNPTTVTMDANMTISAVFVEEIQYPVKYTLTVSPAGSGGVVSLEPAGQIYGEGTEVKLTAVADPGWEFSGWSGDVTGTANPTTVTMNNDMTVSANFVEDFIFQPEKVWLEAENGALMAPFGVAWDEGSSSGSYIVVPNGSGNAWNSSQDAGYAEYEFQISESGDYVIWARVLAPSGSDNSFFITIDGGEFALWDIQPTNIWVWDQVNDRNGPDPVSYNLKAGRHTLIVKQREDGTKLDKILITNDFEFLPNGFGDKNPTILPTLETGEISVDHIWQRVDLTKHFVNPVVVAKPVSSADADPAVVRIKNVTETGFEICVQEWDYLDGQHSPETVAYIVVETGWHTLPGGINLAAGKLQTDKTSSFKSHSFGHDFVTPPVVLASVTSFNESDAVTVRLKNITSSGFDIRMQEQEANSQTHAAEQFCYIAWVPSSGSFNGLNFEVGKTGDAIKHKFATISFYEPFPDVPAFFADMQTTDGGDTANVRWDRKRINGVDVKIAEEQSKDSETRHTTEVVGYIAISPTN